MLTSRLEVEEVAHPVDHLEVPRRQRRERRRGARGRLARRALGVGQRVADREPVELYLQFHWQLHIT